MQVRITLSYQGKEVDDMTHADSLVDALKKVQEGERVVVSVQGQEIALISLADLRLFEDLEDQRDIEEAERRLRTETAVPYASVRKDMGLE